jgi:hypothetical protein
VLTQNEDDANGLIAPFTTGQFSIKTSGDADDKEGDAGGHFTNSFNDQKEIDHLPDRTKRLQKDIDYYHRKCTLRSSGSRLRAKTDKSKPKAVRKAARKASKA